MTQSNLTIHAPASVSRSLPKVPAWCCAILGESCTKPRPVPSSCVQGWPSIPVAKIPEITQVRQDKTDSAAGKRRNRAKLDFMKGELHVERKLRYAWWFVLVVLVIVAVWKLFLPHGSAVYLQKTAASREIVVYVAGAVEKPGLVHLAPDARLDDALKETHPLQEANLDSMNPAEKLKDGQKISVPYKLLSLSAGSTGVGSSSNSVSGNTGNDTRSTNGNGGGSVSVGTINSEGSSSSVTTSGKININTADASELDKLSGVGPALADRIIQYRTEHGLFARPEDLQNVSGIGAKTYEKMASQVTVNP